MSNCILDTSIAESWYSDEVFSEYAGHYHTQFIKNQDSFYAPPLHFLEFSMVLRPLVLKKILSVTSAKNMYSLHLQAPLQVMEPQRGKIVKIALAYQATPYDAVFIQLALLAGFPLLTAEKKTQVWVSKLGERAVVIS